MFRVLESQLARKYRYVVHTLLTVYSSAYFPSLGRRSLSEISPQIVRSPQFRWVWLVYGTTYATANAASSVCGEHGASPVVPVLVASTLTNTTTCIAKGTRLITLSIAEIAEAGHRAERLVAAQLENTTLLL